MARTTLISSGVQSLSKNEGEFRGDLPAAVVSAMGSGKIAPGHIRNDNHDAS